MLAENAELLESLKNAQYKRLSTQYGGTQPVTGEEMKIGFMLFIYYPRFYSML